MTFLSIRGCLALVLLLTGALAQDDTGSDVTGSPVSTCRPEFAKEEDHTMCKVDSDDVLEHGVSKKEKKIILKYHNKVRRGVQPPATDLAALTWDDNLAEVAQKLTMQCKIEHDKNRGIPSYGMFIGQNLAWNQANWKKAMQAWYNEVDLYRYGEEADDYLGPGGWEKIGHYTQMVSNKAHRVGCGFARCSTGRYYACNYAAGQSSTTTPYTNGTERCSACEKKCKKGVCACKGRLCLNRGDLDLNTCKCTCQDIYKGKDCSRLECPETDKWFCGQKTLNDCKKYWNIPFDCPYLCGVCGDGGNAGDGGDAGDNGGDGGANGDNTGNGGSDSGTTTTTTTTTAPPPFVSQYGCQYTGQRLDIPGCAQYGDRGSDTQHCHSKGGEFKCSDCTTYSNIKTDYCPVMCGMCDPPCGMICLNGGTLDPDTCTCTCKGPYKGNLCQRLECPAQENPGCQSWPVDYCEEFSNVPYDCPYLCGICPA